MLAALLLLVTVGLFVAVVFRLLIGVDARQFAIGQFVVEDAVVGIDVGDAEAATFFLGFADGAVADAGEFVGFAVSIEFGC